MGDARVMLAKTYTPGMNPAGWWMSEKLDGVRAYWDGEALYTRSGHRIPAPEFFTDDLPSSPLDGELWLGYGLLQPTAGLVRAEQTGERWRELQFLVFDAPDVDAPFEKRIASVREWFAYRPSRYARPLDQILCCGASHLDSEFARIVNHGGEGVMLRRPGSDYEARRSGSLLKLKPTDDSDAMVVGHAEGSGKYTNQLGALIVETDCGVRFHLGTGLSDEQRLTPPPIGARITFKFQGVTDSGTPRNATFVGVRAD